jgi:acetyl esterase/lipase
MRRVPTPRRRVAIGLVVATLTLGVVAVLFLAGAFDTHESATAPEAGGAAQVTGTSAPPTTAPPTTTIPSLADFLVAAPRPGDLRTSAEADTLPADYVAPPTDEIDEITYGPLPRQHFELLLPPGHVASDKIPVVVYLHSGGWIAGNEPAIPEVLRRQVTRAGLAIASVDYRPVTYDADGNAVDAFPAADYDVDRAVRFLKANAARWGLDPDRVILAGASAGGQLATLEAVAPGAFEDPTLPPELASVSPTAIGAIDMVGPSDFSNFADAGGWAPGIMAAFLGCGLADPASCPATAIAAASPVSYLDASDPPAYLVYGSKDGLVVPATQGTPLAYAWAGARNDFARPPAERGVRYEITSGDHNITPDIQNVRALEQWLDGVLAGRIR